MSRASYILLTLLAVAVPARPATQPPAPATKLLVPAYFYPAGDGLKTWHTLLDTAKKAPVVAIVNPDSGPGKAVDANYTALMKLAEKSPATLIGYVTLSYGKRPLSAVKADVDSWVYFYPGLKGIFFDEQANGADGVAFARAAFAHARDAIPKGVFVTNPGNVCDKAYLADKDGPAACLYEGKDGYDRFRMPAWADDLPPDRFVLLVYNVKTADAMRTTLADCRRHRAGYVFVTDADGPMPWGRLPSYWADELAAVGGGK